MKLNAMITARDQARAKAAAEQAETDSLAELYDIADKTSADKNRTSDEKLIKNAVLADVTHKLAGLNIVQKEVEVRKAEAQEKKDQDAHAPLNEERKKLMAEKVTFEDELTEAKAALKKAEDELFNFTSTEEEMARQAAKRDANDAVTAAQKKVQNSLDSLAKLDPQYFASASKLTASMDKVARAKKELEDTKRAIENIERDHKAKIAPIIKAATDEEKALLKAYSDAQAYLRKLLKDEAFAPFKKPTPNISKIRAEIKKQLDKVNATAKAADGIITQIGDALK
jgi:prefoldin subunit 5